MKLLHTSDWHLGMLCRNGLDYSADQRFFIDKICEIALAEQADGIIIAGDVFDKSIASQEAIQIYDEAMTHMCNDLHLKVYIVAGNHDGAGRLAQCNELLRNSGLYIAGSLTRNPYVVRGEDTDVYLLPWISTDRVKSIYPEASDDINSLEDAYRVVLDEYRKTFIKGHRNVLVSHSYIVNAETSVSDRAAVIGTAAMIGTGVFNDFDYVALGHIHGPQQVAPNIRYSGTPMAYSFGKEEKQIKSITIIDTESFEQKVIPVPALNERHTLSGTYDELLAAEYPANVTDGYVRLEITDRYVGLEGISLLRDKYKRIMEFSSKGFDNEDAGINVTVDDLERIESDPEALFESYCREIIGGEVTPNLKALFMGALGEYEQEVETE